MSEIIEKVETFIQRLHDLDYIVTPEAKKIGYIDKQTNKEISIAHSLSLHISRYEKNIDNELQLSFARLCLTWINKAFTYGVIQEGQGLARKLKEYRDRNAQLESDLEKLSLEYLELQDLNRRLGLSSEEDLERHK